MNTVMNHLSFVKVGCFLFFISSVTISLQVIIMYQRIVERVFKELS